MTDLLTAAEARKVAGIRSPKTWRTLVAKGEITAASTVTDDFGRVTPRFARADVDALAAKRQRPPGLSVYQPFASRILDRTKRYEMRSWALKTTPKRLILCAAARLPEPEHRHLPRGVVLAEITVAKCIPMKDVAGFAWLISEVVPLAQRPVRGGQRLFRLSESALVRHPEPGTFEKKISSMNS